MYGAAQSCTRAHLPARAYTRMRTGAKTHARARAHAPHALTCMRAQTHALTPHHTDTLSRQCALPCLARVGGGWRKVFITFIFVNSSNIRRRSAITSVAIRVSCTSLTSFVPVRDSFLTFIMKCVPGKSDPRSISCTLSLVTGVLSTSRMMSPLSNWPEL